MSRKSKINVLLPIKLIGELDRYSRIGKRSEFISKAIRARLDESSAFSLGDMSDTHMLKIIRSRNITQEGSKLHPILLFCIENDMIYAGDSE